MDILLLNTMQGLKPLYDSDYDEKKKLRIGECYKAKLTIPRNLQFHRKYFALINCAWEYVPERRQEDFGSIEQFRKYLEVSAGHYDLWLSPDLNMWLRIPKSIAFHKMDDAAFQNLYNGVKEVIWREFLNGKVSEQEFTENLVNF